MTHARCVGRRMGLRYGAGGRTMKLLLITVTLICLCGFAAAQDGPVAGERRALRGATPVKGGLELTTSIAREQYCTDGGMMLLLSLSYRNTGSNDLVLFKYAF